MSKANEWPDTLPRQIWLVSGYFLMIVGVIVGLVAYYGGGMTTDFSRATTMHEAQRQNFQQHSTLYLVMAAMMVPLFSYYFYGIAETFYSNNWWKRWLLFLAISGFVAFIFGIRLIGLM